MCELKRMELKVGGRVNTHQMPELESEPNINSIPTAAAAGAAAGTNITSPPLLQPKLDYSSTWTNAFTKPPGYKNLNASNWRWPPKLVQLIPTPSETNANYCIIL